MHLQARHVGGISTINHDTQTNLAAVGRATTSPNINNPPRSKVKWRKRGRSNDVLAKGVNAQVKRKT